MLTNFTRSALSESVVEKTVNLVLFVDSKVWLK